MLKRLARAWFGDFQWQELKKFLMLSSIFFFTIGVYWLLRITKDSVFKTIVTWDMQPYAKIVSVAVVFPLVIVYGMLADRFPRHRLFYVLTAIYTCLAVLFYFLLSHPTIGMANTVADPYRLLGWCYYVFVESFGSIMVALFWAFAADTTTPESAKRGYFIVAMAGQIGAIFGSLVVERFAEQFGTPSLLFAAIFSIVAIAGLVKFMIASIPDEELTGYKAADEKDEKSKKKGKTKIGESIKIMLQNPYLLGIFGVISFFEIIVTVFDFRFKAIVNAAMPGEQFTSYIASYGVMVNLVALISLVFGIGNIGRKLGLKASLSLLPILVGIAAVVMGYHATLNSAFWVMVVSKAINYALNQPAKEQLYIPTTYEAKYKSKAFIEMFGSRSSKGVGSFINSYKQALGENLFVLLSTYVSLGLCAVWLLVALYLGTKHKKAIENNDVVC